MRQPIDAKPLKSLGFAPFGVQNYGPIRCETIWYDMEKICK